MSVTIPSWAQLEDRVAVRQRYGSWSSSKASEGGRAAELAAQCDRAYGPDSIQSRVALERAASAGDQVSAFRLALRDLVNARSETRVAAVEQLGRLAEAQFVPAMSYLAILECSGQVPTTTLGELRGRLERAARSGSDPARILLIARDALGIGGPVATGEALAQARVLSFSDPSSANALIDYLRDGAAPRFEDIHVWVRAILRRWFELDAMLDRAFATIQAASPDGAAIREAAQSARNASYEEFIEGIYLYGVCRAWGVGVDGDPLEGVKLLDQAAKLGLPAAATAASNLRALIRARDQSIPIRPESVRCDSSAEFSSDRECLDWMLYIHDGGEMPLDVWRVFHRSDVDDGGPEFAIDTLCQFSWFDAMPAVVKQLLDRIEERHGVAGLAEYCESAWTVDWSLERYPEGLVFIYCARRGVAAASQRLRASVMRAVRYGIDELPMELEDYLSLLRAAESGGDQGAAAELAILQRLEIQGLASWDEVSFMKGMQYQLECLSLPVDLASPRAKSWRSDLIRAIGDGIHTLLMGEADGFEPMIEAQRFATACFRRLIAVPNLHEFVDTEWLVDLSRAVNAE